MNPCLSLNWSVEPAVTPAGKVRCLSFIVPTHDEAWTLRGLYQGIRRQAEAVADDWEILFIDRGSGVTTCRTIEELSRRDPGHVRGDCDCGARSRSDALALGYRMARGVYVFTVEPDLDDDPGEIPRFLERIRGGGDEVETGGEHSDRWRKILPRGVLRRMT